MQFVPLTTDHIEESTALYESAFPEIERRDTPEWVALIGHHPNFKPIAIIGDDSQFCGFITCWQFPTFIYVEHFAIRPDQRGKKLGEKTMQWLIAQNPDTNIVLEVECPDNEMARRRIGFYQRCGLQLTERPYLQPPYRQGAEYLPLKLMSTRPQHTETQFEYIKTTIHQTVYGVKS